ncbi:MAG: protein tyrosine/serine phosphatase [Acidimicrobiaceae bacterium]|nr:protein tyrosine/serine phosphatase [Acidimicrobiaceae bacterium]
MSVLIEEHELLARRLPLAGTYNVRDIGGYPTADGRSVRWKTLLRGDALHKVDDEGRELLAGYGLRTSLDLRELEECVASPDRLHDEVQLVSLPLFSYGAPGAAGVAGSTIERAKLTTLRDTYFQLVRERGPVLVMVIRELTKPGALPAIVHCTAGKDRTGIVVALVLAALGVPDEVIAADFAATSLFLGDDFREGVVAQTVAAGFDEKRVTAMLSCEPELILGVLEDIRASHGDVERYLLEHGLDASELEALRALLLEDAASPTDPAHDTEGVTARD